VHVRDSQPQIEKLKKADLAQNLKEAKLESTIKHCMHILMKEKKQHKSVARFRR
jgi:hypothetical protein